MLKRHLARRSLVALAALALLPATIRAAHAAAAVDTAVMPAWTKCIGAGGEDSFGSIASDPSGTLWAVHVKDMGADGVRNVLTRAYLPVTTADEQTYGIGFDNSGYAYVSKSAEIDVFAPGAKAGAKPVRVIKGTATKLPGGPSATDDSMNMTLEVSPSGAVLLSDHINGTILSFPAGAKGNVAPKVYTAAAVGDEDHIERGQDGSLVAGVKGGIKVFSWSSTGVLTLSRTISGASTGIGAAVTPHGTSDNFGNVYVTTGNWTDTAPSDNRVRVFAPGAKGNAAPVKTYVVSGNAAPLTGVIVTRDRTVYVRSHVDFSKSCGTDVYLLTKLGALVDRHTATIQVSGYTLPTATATGSLTVSVSAAGAGGYLAGNVRFVATGPGLSIMKTVVLSGGGWEPAKGTATVVIPKLGDLPKAGPGTYTATIEYGGNGDFTAARLSFSYAVG